MKVVVPKNVKRKTILDLELSDTIKSELVELLLPGNSKAIGKQIVNLEFPKTAMIILLSRNGKYIQPSGSTILEEGDKLLVLANNKEVVEEVREDLGIL